MYLKRFGGDGKGDWSRSWKSETYFQPLLTSRLRITHDGIYLILDGKLLKLDQNGNEVWTQELKGCAVDLDVMMDRIYVGGFVTEGATGGSDAFLAAFDSDGSLLWYRRRETNGVEGDTAIRVCATPDAVYLLVIGSKGWTLKTITKFDPKGNQRWDQRLEDDRIYNDLKYFNDYLYAAGTLNNDALIAKLDLEGRILWNKTIGKPDREDYAAGIFLDKNHIYVVGTTESYTKWSQRIAFLNIYRIIK